MEYVVVCSLGLKDYLTNIYSLFLFLTLNRKNTTACGVPQGYVLFDHCFLLFMSMTSSV